MSLSTLYDFTRVDSENIRVVHVAAGRWHDPIRCKLLRRGLDEASETFPYRALSYVWGSSKVTETIYLEEQPFQITLNLSCALRHLRKVEQDICLWVDALCINQQDQQERSLQVGIMQFIYKNAEEVVVFMGDDRGHRVSRSQLMESPSSPTITLHGHERDKPFLTDILKTCQSIKPREIASSLTGAACAMGLISLFSDQDAVERVCVELMSLKQEVRYYLFECLRDFVVCPWWSRIWVVQEVAVGTAITVRYGTITISWEAMVATAGVCSLPETRQVATNAGIEPENLKVLRLFVNQLIGLEQTRSKWHAEGGTDLVRLLQEFSDRQSTDDRDKVYGLLSLVKQDQQYVKPDYELDVYKTYRATALALIGNGGTLACWAGDQKRKSNRNLPSWIPDWSTAVAVGDKRRMDLFHYYEVNRGWTLRVIATELEYWAVVEEQMELLLNSPAAQAARLPASLSPFVHAYIEILTDRVDSLYFPRDDAEALERWASYPFIWNKRSGTTLASTISRLKWYDQHWIFSLLEQRIRDFEKRRERDLATFGGAVSSSVPDDSSVGEQIHQDLLELVNKVEKEDEMGISRRHMSNTLLVTPELALKRARTRSSGSAHIPREANILIIRRLIHQCRRLSSLCQASDNDIDPERLFQTSYSLQDTAKSLIRYQSKLAELLGSSSSANESIPIRRNSLTILTRRGFPRPQILDFLKIQTIKVDVVTECGPRQFGWADAASALTILISWLYLSSPFTAANQAEEKDINLHHPRLRQFTKTIVGGISRRNGSYQEADDSTLGPLEDWLQRSLMLRLQKSPVIKNYASPPSPFFEDIQIATDDRVFFMSENGSMGLGPASMRKGDTIHVLPSGSAHFVLRSRAMPFKSFELLGDCYVQANGGPENQKPAKEEPAVEGSLPFELLGERYLREKGMPTRDHILLV